DPWRVLFAVFLVGPPAPARRRPPPAAGPRRGARPPHADLRGALDRVEALTRVSADTLEQLRVPEVRADVNRLLLRTSELVRATAGGKPRSRRGADLVGKRLRGARLRGTDLRGALLIAADLTGADLSLTDLIGADLRDADLSGADLTGALFLTQPQLNAARGNADTRVPEGFERPAHWTA
ncbi:pentapeptide repeat-containing protein, partial [Streptomyces sp. NPDC058671]|uniref:pentapeptide repeat-containing protein n=1 Tax=Streptomyces sp. NPDC058671 TaxID=3346590 RepID=UPI00366021A5